jgi:hypothetical protein
MTTTTYRWTPDYLGPEATHVELDRYVDEVLAELRKDAGNPHGDDVDWVSVLWRSHEWCEVTVNDDRIDEFNLVADCVRCADDWIG